MRWRWPLPTRPIGTSPPGRTSAIGSPRSSTVGAEECKRLSAELAHKSAACERLSAELTWRSEARELLEAELAGRSAECERLSAELDHRSQEYHRLAADLDALRRPWTRRWSAPLRSASG